METINLQDLHDIDGGRLSIRQCLDYGTISDGETTYTVIGC